MITLVKRTFLTASLFLSYLIMKTSLLLYSAYYFQHMLLISNVL